MRRMRRLPTLWSSGGYVQGRRDGGVGRMRGSSTAGTRALSGAASGRTTATFFFGATPVRGGGVIVMVVILVVLLDVVTRTAADRQATWDIGGRAGDVHWPGRAAEGRADGHSGRQRAMGGIETCLNKILALWLSDQGLELSCSESIDEPSL